MAQGHRPGDDNRPCGLHRLLILNGALVTGAGSGIGRAVAAALAHLGYGVGCADSDFDAARKTAQRLDRSVPLRLDVRSGEETRRAVAEMGDRFGGLDVAVACAGVHRQGHATEMPVVLFEEVMAVNVTGSFLTAANSARAMIDQGTGGSIVLIGSMNSVVVSMPGQVAYAASKGGVLMMGKALAVDLAEHGIRVNIVLPGITATPLSEPVLADDTTRAAALGNVPMGRPAQPEQVAAAIAFLVSPGAAMVTGAAVPVDGGQLALTSGHPWVF